MDVCRFQGGLFSLRPSCLLPHDCADVESLSPGSSDEEPDEGEEDERGAEVTSLDRALRTVTETADDGEEDFLKHNFEMPNESCSTGKRRGQTLKRRLDLP